MRRRLDHAQYCLAAEVDLLHLLRELQSGGDVWVWFNGRYVRRAVLLADVARALSRIEFVLRWHEEAYWCQAVTACSDREPAEGLDAVSEVAAAPAGSWTSRPIPAALTSVVGWSASRWRRTTR
jgi:hypothetical protein